MTQARPPAVAGTFYPADPHVLTGMIRDFLAEVTMESSPPKAMVVPHAGYVFSGPIAASAYAQIVPLRDTIERVVLLGPSHRVYLDGLALSSAEVFSTPLGDIPIDAAAVASIEDMNQVGVFDAAHAAEHSLEVHLPLLQETLTEFSLVPLVVGDAKPGQVAAVLERLWGGPETLLVVSSDLSHFLDYETAVRVDRQTSDAIEALHGDIRPEQACGCRPLNGLLHFAKGHGLEISTIDVRNSGDTAGTRDRVVGYGSYLVA